MNDFEKAFREYAKNVTGEEIAAECTRILNAMEQEEKDKVANAEKKAQQEKEDYIALQTAKFEIKDWDETSLEDVVIVAMAYANANHPEWSLDTIKDFGDMVKENLDIAEKFAGKTGQDLDNIVLDSLRELMTGISETAAEAWTKEVKPKMKEVKKTLSDRERIENFLRDLDIWH